jgi:hypothetical protein
MTVMVIAGFIRSPYDAQVPMAMAMIPEKNAARPRYRNRDGPGSRSWQKA